MIYVDLFTKTHTHRPNYTSFESADRYAELEWITVMELTEIREWGASDERCSSLSFSLRVRVWLCTILNMG